MGINHNRELSLAIDAMGGDNAPDAIIKGANLFAKANPKVNLIIHGDSEKIAPLIANCQYLSNAKIVHAPQMVPMDAKPSQAMRKKDTSMWGTISSVKAGDADAAVSAGNTGALMAVANLQLRTIEGLHRPAIAASWPNPRGTFSVVLDVGANVDSDPDQLVDFAIMGEAFAQALYGIERPKVGLLNVGSEEVKGHEDIREAMRLLRLHGASLGMEVYGFVEGTDISMGTTDVVVTDGFTGNIALKSAEGAAKLFAKFLKESLSSDPISMLGALIASGGFKKLKEKIDPRASNGGVFLGLNGIVIKSHGGTDAEGFEAAMGVAAKLAQSNYQDTIANNLKRLIELRKTNAAQKPAIAELSNN